MRIKRENAMRKRALREYQKELPYWVNWFVFSQHQPDNLYDEPGDRSYDGPYQVPILWLFDEESDDTLMNTGREIRRMITFAVSVQALINHGIDPEPDDRVNDMVEWDGFYWDVQQMLLTSITELQSDPGNLIYPRKGDDLTARIRAIRRFPEHDLPHESFPD